MNRRLNTVFVNNTILSLFFCFSTHAQVDNLTANIEKATKEEKIRIYKTLIEEYKHTDVDKTLTYAHEGLELVEIKDSRNKGYFYSTLGMQYAYKSDYQRALFYNKEALKIAEKLKYRLGVALSSQNIGVVHAQLGNFQESLNSNLEALAIFEELENRELALCILINLGDLYSNRFYDYKNAKLYFDKAISLGRNSTNQRFMTEALMNVGDMYINQNLLSKAEEKLLEAFFISEKENYLDLTARIMSVLSSLCIEKKDFKQALKYLKRSIDIELTTGVSNCAACEYLKLADIYDHLGDDVSALLYFEKAEKKALEDKELPKLSEIYKLLQQYHAKRKNFQKGYDYLIKYTAVKDSLFTIEKDKQISELLIKHEAKKKEREISFLKKDNELQTTFIEKQKIELEKQKLEETLEIQEKESELVRVKIESDFKLLSAQKEKDLQSAVLKNTQAEMNRQTLVYYGIIILSLILFISSLIVLYFYRQKLKNKELLTSKNEEINKQKTLKLIHDQEIRNAKVNIVWQEKEKERISGELHDGVAPSIAAVKLGLLKISETFDNDSRFKNLIQIADNAYEEIRNVSHNFSSSKLSNTPFTDLLENYLNEIANTNTIKVIFRCNLKEKTNQISDEIKVEIYRIIQESMNNILKHAKSNYAEVQLTWNENNLNLIVEDTGIGFDVYKKSFGIGLSNIKSRVNVLQGTIDIDSLMNRGTIINIDIPVY